MKCTVGNSLIYLSFLLQVVLSKLVISDLGINSYILKPNIYHGTLLVTKFNVFLALTNSSVFVR